MAQSLWLIGLTIGTLPFLVISVMKGQLGCLSLLALFAAYQAWKQKPLPAGIILGFALIKPTVTVAPVVIFLLWALWQRNWKFLAGFAGSMTILLATSYFLVGNWIPGYFAMLKVKVGFPVLWSMDFLSAPWNILYAALFAGILILSIYLSLKRNRTDWFSAAVLAGIALTPMRWIYDLFLAILILVEKRRFSPLQSVMACIAILSPWLLVLIPVTIRWYVAVVGLPLIWAATVLSLILYEKRGHMENQDLPNE